MISTRLLLVIAYISLVSCIQNGQDVTSQNKYPFYIMIGNPHICGGTLISYDPALVLTAAHCLDAPIHPTNYTRDKNPYFALYDDVHRDKQKAVAIVDWNIHPLYNVSGNVNVKYDVAIVRLETPLRKSARIKRTPLWSPSLAPNPSKAELIGFGYKDTEGHLAQTLQSLKLEITKIDSNGTDYIESKTDTENQIACHGDSGGPLIVYQEVLNFDTNKSVTVPFVLGDLTRIYGARDDKPDQLNCPVPLNTTNGVSEIFTNVVSLMDWISTISGISRNNLTDPFYDPPHKKTSSHPNVNDDDDERPKWSIGVVADENGLLDTHDDDEEESLWIGSMAKDFYMKAESSSSSRIKPSILLFTILFINIFT